MDHEEYEKKQRAMHRRDNLRKAPPCLFRSVLAVAELFPFYWMVIHWLDGSATSNAGPTPVLSTV